MKFSIVLSFLSFLALALPFAAGNPLHGHHNAIARRALGEVDLNRRSFQNMRMTFYYAGLGACGITNTDDDHIVALNAIQFGTGYPGEYCFKNITISYNGVEIQATVTDRCEVCPWGGLDLTPGLFAEFVPESDGVFAGNWWFT